MVRVYDKNIRQIRRKNAMIHLQDIKKSFKGNIILDNLNLHIPKEKITVLIGRSGGGKSVTLKHIIGLIKPDSGQVLIKGVDLTRLSGVELNHIREKFGMLFQDGALFDSMTVGENVAFPLVERTSQSKEEIEKRVKETLQSVGLEGIEEKLPSELSGGMRKRVGLARAIVMNPEIILYDEPTTGLDPLMTDTINKLIVDTQKRLQMTTFIISHDIEAAMRIADKLAVLYKGKIIAEGSPKEISACDHPFVEAFIKGHEFGGEDDI